MDFIVDGYAHCNLGDDLFFLHLAKRYPNQKFYIFASSKYKSAFKSCKNVIIPGSFYKGMYKIARILKIKSGDKVKDFNAAARIYMGGSIYQECVRGKKSTPRGEKDENPFFVIGCNLEKDYSDEYMQRITAAISKSVHCTVRDSFSYCRLKSLPNVTYAPDVLFDYDTGLAQKKGTGIIISVLTSYVRPDIKEFEDNYYHVIAELCDLCVENRIPVTLFGFCEDVDETAIDSILHLINHPESVGKYQYTGNTEEALQLLNECETVIATRFHAMILGWVLNKNVVPIIYNSKQTHVLEDLHFTGEQWRMICGEKITGEQLLEKINKMNGYIDVSPLRIKSKEHFFALDRFIGDSETDK